ncbi:prolipoprotein diacylglyceryl transferase [Hymenobacter sp. 15J16-1T3B]|uniref:prolipoprotein diacylglyceryl transferase family protein n=1 Tax=Hymenobacter sp. 15J16-1T3B TaxID=2886941 RepID=UPI001D12F767|nr:prolipoprotein diacylglyceryl transferase family protein [Hymenobacter sp. 15J16-1T3B]MCC3158508.1 prolipoprotein diacylglyceryl transferase [Hymenobacter sp. 15J16-1T3B]
MPHLSSLLLPSPVGHQYYTTFYVLAFLLNQALLLWVGYRRGYPLRSWLLLTTGVTLAFIVGTKLIAAPGTDWAALWQHGQWPAGTARSVLGGAVGAAVAGLVLRRWLGYSWHALDAFCLPTAAAYAVQCVGCLLTGCCFGHVAEWGVSYAPGTLPFLVQVQRGLIPATAAHSLPVLPTQAVAGLLVLGVGGLLWHLRHRPWPGGSWRLLQVALLLAGRFLIEFWRDPAGEQVGAGLTAVGGIALKQVQWALLPLLLLAGWGWWRRTRPRAAAPAPEAVPAQQSVRILLGVAVMLGLTALLGPAAFTLPEVLVIKSGLTVVLLAEAVALVRRRAEAGPHRLSVPLGLASVVLLFTNQAPAPVDSAAGRHYLTLSLGSSAGGYDEDRTVVPPSGCSGSGGPTLRNAYYHRYAAHGGSVAYTVDNPRRDFAGAGVGVWLGPEHQGVRALTPSGPFLTGSPDSTTTRRLFSVNPYIEFHETSPKGLFYMDYRLGLHIGRLAYPHRNKSFELRPAYVFPDMLLRAGKAGGFFGQMDTGYGPAAVGNFSARLGVGTGLRSARSNYVMAGIGGARNYPHGAMGFVSGRLRLGATGLVLEPYAATNFGRFYQVSGQLFYNLPLDRRKP